MAGHAKFEDVVQLRGRCFVGGRDPNVARLSIVERLAVDPIPGFLLDMVEAGGLLPQLKRRMQQQKATT